MYTANKIETFRPAHRRGYEPSRRHLIFCLLTASLFNLAAFANVANAAIYYVATNGDDSHSKVQAQNIGTPWQTINHGASQLSPGDILLVRGGTYRETVAIGVSGTAENRITIKNYPGEKPIIDGSEILTGWTKCESQVACGGNPNWQNIYYAYAPSETTLFTANLYQNDEMLSISQHPNPSDPFYMDEEMDYLTPDSITSSSVTDVRLERFGGADLIGSWVGVYRTYPWGVTYKKIADYNAVEFKITYEEMSGSGHESYSLLNNLNDVLLDKAGEYYVNETPEADSTHKIYLWSLNNQNLSAKGEVTVSLRDRLINVDSSNYITFEGFKIQKATGIVIRVTTTGSRTGQIFRNNEITKCRASAEPENMFYFFNCDDAIFENNYLHQNAGRLRGIVFGGGSSNVIVRNNIISKQGGSCVLFQDVIDGQITNNTVTGSRGSHSNGYSVYQGSDNVLVANNIALGCNAALTYQASSNLYIYNNLFTGHPDTLYVVANWAGMTGDVFFLNNIVHESIGKSSLHIGEAGNVVCINNIIYGNSDWQEIDTRSHNIHTILSWREIEGWNWELEEGGVLADGKSGRPDIYDIFVDPDNDDFRLKVGSPAINAGTDITPYLPTEDFPDFDFSRDILGVSRVFPPDAGCYEYIPSDPNSPSYSITASASGGGTISPSGTTQVASGGSQTYNITPNAGYHISDVLVDGSSVGYVTSYPFTNVTADHTIAATFAIDTYTITAIAGDGGQISPSGITQVASGGSQAYTITENTGYHISDVVVDGSSVGPVTSYPFTNVTADHTIAATFAIDTYTLNVTAVNGSVTKTPDKASYNYGETVTLETVADTGYSFANWSGAVTGSTNPATVVMNADKSVTANFAINTYTLNITALNGSVTKTPDKASYNYGEEVTLQATADTGYNFVNWSGDVSGSSNPATVVMDADKSVTANFAINTYTLNVTAVDGSVTKTPDQASYNYGEEVTLQAEPDTGYHFLSWSGDASGDSNSVTIVMNADKSVTANFAIDEVDLTTPAVTNLSPQAESIQAPLNTLVILDITDSGDGVDANSVIINVNNNLVYSGNKAKHSSTYGECHRIGTKAKYRFIYQSNEMFDFDQPINVTAKATDLAGNVMNEYSYSFKTEMRSFGKNKRVDPRDVKKGRPVTVRDSNGDIWAAWHAGMTDSRNIYIGKLAVEEENFGSSVPLTSDAAECNPVIAVGSDGKLYVAWQDNRRGNWDIYISTSNDWFAEIRVTDSDANQINPAIVVDSSLPNNAYIVWEDDRHGNQDIYVAKSSDGFVTKTVSPITSDSSDQVEPAIAADSDNTIYVVWTDTRIRGKKDIYGAASNDGPWTNIPVVAEEDGQSSPAIATEADGPILHLVWVDDRTTDGDDDIFYAKTTGGLTPLTGSSIIDDDTGADQISPVIITTGTGNDLKVFACWRDERWANADLYFAEISSDYSAKISSGDKANVFVGDGGTNSDQSEPAIGIDGHGHPYLVWTNERTDICYAGSTFIESKLASTNVSITSEATVGTMRNAIQSIDDVSAEVPQGAYLCDVEVTISKIKNPQKFNFERSTGVYEFGPSGMEFTKPVTITIPYEVNGSENVSYKAYWYNSLTNTLSQQGITHVETIVISSNLHALRFKTTHFSPFILGGALGGLLGGGGGGGGCSMSPNSQDSIAELLLPYIGLAVAMVLLKLRDRRKRKAHNIAKS